MDIYFYLSNFLIKIFVFYITYEPFSWFEEAYLKKNHPLASSYSHI